MLENARYIKDEPREDIAVFRDGKHDRVGRKSDTAERLCLPAGLSDDELKRCIWCFEEGHKYGKWAGEHRVRREFKILMGLPL